MNTAFDQCFLEGDLWTLNPLEEPELDETAEYPTPFSTWMEEEFMNCQRCPYCGTRIHRREFFDDDDDKLGAPDLRGGDFLEDVADLAWLWSCRTCAYWQWFSVFENRGMHGNAAMSILAKFDHTVPEGCWNELAQHLRRNETLWHSLDPHGMERLVAELFRSNYADAEVIHIGKPGDLGIDVVFVESTGHKWLIQVKRRARSGAVEGFETVQKLLGTLLLEGQLLGIVASNASHFSYQARRQANRASEKGYVVRLLDRGKLNRMLGALLPAEPWREYLRRIGISQSLQQGFADKLRSSASADQLELDLAPMSQFHLPSS